MRTTPAIALLALVLLAVVAYLAAQWTDGVRAPGVEIGSAARSI